MLDESQMQNMVYTRIIELSSLANAQTTTANDQNLLNIDRIGSSFDDSALNVRFRAWRILGVILEASEARKKTNASGVRGSIQLLVGDQAASRGPRREESHCGRASYGAALAEKIG